MLLIIVNSSPSTTQRLSPTSPLTSKDYQSSGGEAESDTIIVYHGTDSSAQNEYETANEVIEDSDDAPDIMTIGRSNRAPRNTQRTPKTKQQTRIEGLSNVHEGASSSNRDSSANSGIASLPWDNIHGNDATAVYREIPIPRGQLAVSKEDPEQLPQSKLRELDDTHSPANDAATKNFSAPSDDIGDLPTGATPATQIPTQVSPATQDADPQIVKTSSGTDTVQSLSASTAHSGPVFYSIQVKPDRGLDAKSPQIRDVCEIEINVGQPQARGPTKLEGAHAEEKQLSRPANVRLADPARSSLSKFQRTRIEQRAAGSGKGFRLEREWGSKRSAFTVS